MPLTVVSDNWNRVTEAYKQLCELEPDDRDRNLRRELADAIADRNAADGRARIAKEVADRAEEAKREANLTATHLKRGLDEGPPSRHAEIRQGPQ